MSVKWIALLFVTAALAGCAGAETHAQPNDSLGLEATSETGLIRGVVVDDAIVPIEGAVVSLMNQDLSTVTNEVGLFGFDGLPEGNYFLIVNADGFTEVQQSAIVVAGDDDPPIQKVTLPRIPQDQRPYVIPSQYTAYVNCAALIGTDLRRCDPQNLLFGTDDSEPFFDAPALLPDFLQIETNWDANQQGGDRITLTVYACDLEGACDGGSSSPQRMCQVWGPSHQMCKISQHSGWGNPDGTGGGNGLKSAAFGVGDRPGFKTWIAADCAEALCVPGTAIGVGLLVQQEVEVFNHVFYNFLPSEDWVFLEDGAPPIPS